MKTKNNPTTVASEPKQMTLTVRDVCMVDLIIAGKGVMTIDWGDGTPLEPYTLKAPYKKEVWGRWNASKYHFLHSYNDNVNLTITQWFVKNLSAHPTEIQ